MIFIYVLLTFPPSYTKKLNVDIIVAIEKHIILYKQKGDGRGGGALYLSSSPSVPLNFTCKYINRVNAVVYMFIYARLKIKLCICFS
jgi:hypothetical protein